MGRLQWFAAAALAAAVMHPLLRTGDGTVRQVRQPTPAELFSFVRALPADTRDIAVQEAEVQAVPDVAPEPAGPGATEVFLMEEAVQRMRAQGASEDEVYRARAAATNAETAAALARLEYEEALWRRRVAAYTAQRQAAGGDPQALQALKDGLFSPEEQERLAAHEPAAAPRFDPQ